MLYIYIQDLEIAADFSILTSTPQLLQALQASDHVQVQTMHSAVF